MSLSGYAWETDPVALATRDDVDVFVELMGGSEGLPKTRPRPRWPQARTWSPPTRRCWPSTVRRWPIRPRAAGRVIRYEAAVAGGIPVIKSLTEGLAGNEITRVMGVMNGTCNYILTHGGQGPGL